MAEREVINTLVEEKSDVGHHVTSVEVSLLLNSEPPLPVGEHPHLIHETPDRKTTSEGSFSPATRKQRMEVLSARERRNICWLILAWACVIASLTLVVGTGPVVLQSVAPHQPNLAPFSLGAFFLGMSFISLSCTHWIFQRWGRRYGFWFGIGCGLIGVGIAVRGLYHPSPGMVIFAYAWLGAGSGMGMYVRFGAAEVVPDWFREQALTWTLTGGCIAAFVGPELASATKGMFGPRHNLTYLGAFWVAGLFYILQGTFVSLVTFPSSSADTQLSQTATTTRNSTTKEDAIPPSLDSTETGEKTTVTCRDVLDLDARNIVTPHPLDETYSLSEQLQHHLSHPPQELAFWKILCHPTFVVPLLVATCSWAIMAMPMSIFRVIMSQIGYSERQSLTVMEFHFLSMYAPGFVSGSFLKRYGPFSATWVSIGIFGMAIVVDLLASTYDNEAQRHHIGFWYAGLMLLGCGWNFGFSAATIWIMNVTKNTPLRKPHIQAANECGMFLGSGAAIFSTGYIVQAGGGALDGWRLLNWILLAWLGCFLLIVLFFGRWTVRMAAHTDNSDRKHSLFKDVTKSKEESTE